MSMFYFQDIDARWPDAMDGVKIVLQNTEFRFWKTEFHVKEISENNFRDDRYKFFSINKIVNGRI